MSLPVRGAWIEMDDGLVNMTNSTMSLPVRGAWIEIGGYYIVVDCALGRSP